MKVRGIIFAPMNMYDQPFGASITSFCPHCETKYEDSDIRLLKQLQNSKTLHLFCGNCTRSMLFYIEEKQHGMTCAGAFTDWNFKDAKKFLNADIISIDDVLSAHNALSLDNFLQIR